jgi:hypothetical protein
MIIEPFSPRHLWEIDLQPAQRSWYLYASPEYAESLARGMAYTARVRGRIVACGGILPVDEDTGHLWCFLAAEAGRHFVRLHRTAQRFLRVAGKRVLVATSEADFVDGCRWLELLGFQRASRSRLPKYGPDGADHICYEKVL